MRKCKRQIMSHRFLDPYFNADRCRLQLLYVQYAIILCRLFLNGKM